MNAMPLAAAALRVRLALARLGIFNCIALALLLAAAVAWQTGTAYLHAQTEATRRTLAQARATLHAPAQDAHQAASALPQHRLAAFYAALGERRYAEQQVKTLFAIAAKSGLNLDQAEYRAAFDRTSGVTAYQIQLPVKGSYEAIRMFCEQTLLAIPFASLDDIGFKREAIGDTSLEARLRLTLYLADSSRGPASAALQTVAQEKRP